jgi:DNA mismatch endonuclease (patch repair protein)
MESIRSRNTRPEIALRRQLHRKGLRYLVGAQADRSLRRTVDIVFPKLRIAVFVDGCFWHGCPEHGSKPRINSAYWVTKLARNRERDADTVMRLQALGWSVLRFWEHDDALTAAETVARLVAAKRAVNAGPMT